MPSPKSVFAVVAPIRQILEALRTSAAVKFSPLFRTQERASMYSSETPDTCTKLFWLPAAT